MLKVLRKIGLYLLYSLIILVSGGLGYSVGYYILGPVLDGIGII